MPVVFCGLFRHAVLAAELELANQILELPNGRSRLQHVLAAVRAGMASLLGLGKTFEAVHVPIRTGHRGLCVNGPAKGARQILVHRLGKEQRSLEAHGIYLLWLPSVFGLILSRFVMNGCGRYEYLPANCRPRCWKTQQRSGKLKGPSSCRSRPELALLPLDPSGSRYIRYDAVQRLATWYCRVGVISTSTCTVPKRYAQYRHGRRL